VSVTKDLSVKVGTGGAAKSTLDVTGTHRIDASDTVDVQAPHHVKLTCGNSSITLLPDKIILQIEKGAKIEIDANVLALSKEKSQLLLKSDALLASKDESTVKLDANATMSSGGDATMQSTKAAANVTGATKVALAGAKTSQLDLEAAGATMNSAKTKVAGKGLLELTGPMIKIN
jgi:type VI secretion system secreted protein VgrG